MNVEILEVNKNDRAALVRYSDGAVERDVVVQIPVDQMGKAIVGPMFRAAVRKAAPVEMLRRLSLGEPTGMDKSKLEALVGAQFAVEPEGPAERAHIEVMGARRVKKKETLAVANGWVVERMAGDSGECIDTFIPAGDIEDAPFISLFESGFVTNVEMETGLRYVVSNEHPLGRMIDDEGVLGEEYPIRPAQKVRVMFEDGTSRLCISRCDPHGEPVYALIGRERFNGAGSVVVESGQVFVLCVGTGKVDGVSVGATQVVAPMGESKTVELDAGAYGARLWTRS